MCLSNDHGKRPKCGFHRVESMDACMHLAIRRRLFAYSNILNVVAEIDIASPGGNRAKG
jgi:hypothetical protein